MQTRTKEGWVGGLLAARIVLPKRAQLFILVGDRHALQIVHVAYSLFVVGCCVHAGTMKILESSS